LHKTKDLLFIPEGLYIIRVAHLNFILTGLKRYIASYS
jgi:hypothetical protein